MKRPKREVVYSLRVSYEGGVWKHRWELTRDGQWVARGKTDTILGARLQAWRHRRADRRGGQGVFHKTWSRRIPIDVQEYIDELEQKLGIMS